ncbi:MAG: 2-succinyl-5-enolpyruvyl-6-hydroxy-3-cyclohexene-1-carboxylic-acid synthase [Tessaracoccus sp.]|uniref:2-succinyl-5-enolpyruvyl-6-hydroxy-3- cyclohexene-1-carboxylic-acid synthase n=1 Tax=Tessaracoccus sp. TaxID=1971211 RepID=UPI001ECB6FD1|nr:2-succinyl-5-enolpyruvyl-6-hydroxy-3-cyclohexene-1-carboxylic-acid synthase [Tessaracoccus sp.]MBK7821937.1 2-succinyl-5-enolpyruvyl-6-hydroxy-3-cyclohexene-1-carboxylic-acid synthase [Tessaracoccus sp.]
MSSIELGAVVVDALRGAGVTDVVLAPGSRSAALALAADRADRAGDLRLHVRIDERVAGFTALGLAKASGRPVAVVTTSGTAVANLGPAAMEATAAGVPLLFVTADRPAHLVGTGANQCGDQAGAFGPAALAVIRLSSESGSAAAWAAGVHRALAVASGARTRQPGAVQLNIEFAEPLVGELPAPREFAFEIAESSGHRVAELDARRTVVLVGDATPEVGAEARALAEVSGAPLLAEPSSNARAGANAVADYRLRLADLGPRIERVIVFGHPTLSRPVSRLLARDDVELVVVTDRATWPDPGHRAALVADRVLLAPQDASWLGEWTNRSLDPEAASEAPARVIALRAATPSSASAIEQARLPSAFVGVERSETLTQTVLAATVLAALGPGDDLVLGASSIIRAADLAPVAERPPRIFANRGLAGIDGTVATATGIALATGRPTTVLLGDLTAQHDLGGLVRPPSEPWPRLRVVVADDGGGSIFRTLEQGAPEYAASFERVFGTPQGLDLAAVAAAMGWRTTVVETAAELTAALEGEAGFVVAKLVPRLGLLRKRWP